MDVDATIGFMMDITGFACALRSISGGDGTNFMLSYNLKMKMKKIKIKKHVKILVRERKRILEKTVGSNPIVVVVFPIFLSLFPVFLVFWNPHLTYLYMVEIRNRHPRLADDNHNTTNSEWFLP